jgi:hypothetical protein
MMHHLLLLLVGLHTSVVESINSSISSTSYAPGRGSYSFALLGDFAVLFLWHVLLSSIQ